MILINKLLGIGTNRVVFTSADNKVVKIPIGERGKLANLQEYNNSINKSFIATTSYQNGILFQEELCCITIFPFRFSRKKLLRKLKRMNISNREELVENKLCNRLQIGKSLDGKWKIFDCEDVKYYENNNRFTFHNEHT